ncbi:response regulator [Ramlibacter sp. WS9]|uniref:sensor histidine kinase n=1 Tax=Ramlibacter sp. WS9 TaxID=1882741 RepID=UPI001141218A|nr:response regulator [Ramlibacter sp. WS9]ROZ61713.1 response regulator [Ramlibacter sp. WS9]
MTPLAPSILIVDDEAQNRRLLETLLRPEGYRMQSAANGEEALMAIAQQLPDLILLDIMMPGIDGYQLAGILKAAPATSRIPIIVITALVDREARLAALKAGAEEFLTKPVDRAELWLRVRNLLRLKAYGDLQDHSTQLEQQVQARTEEIMSLNAGLEERVRQRTAQLHGVNQELEAFSYSLSHDLRTPLSAIDGFSDLLGSEIGAGAATDRGKHYLARIRAGVAYMSQLIDAMLLLAHVSRTPPRWVPVNLSTIAQRVLEGCLERQPDRVVHWDIEPDLVARGDPQLLQQVLENLLGNAWKFCGHQAQTRISFSCGSDADGRDVYAVHDNGAGFDMAYSNKLFGTFQRLHGASEFPGTGIGLATVHRIISRHGGKVWADSVEGQGANFYFTLGLEADAAI